MEKERVDVCEKYLSNSIGMTMEWMQEMKDAQIIIFSRLQ